MSHKRNLLTAVSFAALIALSACKTTDTALVGKSIDSLNGHAEAAEARLSTAAAEAIAAGKVDEAAVKYEKLYAGNKKDKEIALNYAQLLRKTGHADKAVDVLSPFAAKTAKDNPLVLNEYGASLIASGDAARAEDILNRVLEDEKSSDFHADAYNLMGIALDAKGQHKEAEQMFRLSLESWKGNPTSVMNNLSLCLASQGLFDESLVTLRKALVMAPDKQEIARNIQIVEDLRSSVVARAPVDLKKSKKK